MKILSGRSNLPLAKKIAEQFGLELTKVEITEFNAGEVSIFIKQQLADQVVVIVQSTASPVNTYLVELLLLIRAAKEAKASKIIVIVPYFGYGRSDKKFSEGGVIAAKLVADMLQVAGAGEIITIDLHSRQILDFFSLPVLSLEPKDLYLGKIELKANLVIISPDLGGKARAKDFAQVAAANLAVITKQRLENGSCLILDINAEIKGKNCLIIDDILDTGQTLTQVVEFLMQHGANSVDCLISHGLLSEKTASNLAQLPVDNIYLSNSIDLSCYNLGPKFKIIDIAAKIALRLSKII